MTMQKRKIYMNMRLRIFQKKGHCPYSLPNYVENRFNKGPFALDGIFYVVKMGSIDHNDDVSLPTACFSLSRGRGVSQGTYPSSRSGMGGGTSRYLPPGQGQSTYPHPGIGQHMKYLIPCGRYALAFTQEDFLVLSS